jgi:hypothetical protein
MHFYELKYFLGHRGLQDKYNIGLLLVNIELIWLGAKRGERLAKSSSCHPVSHPRQINYIFTISRPILYIYIWFFDRILFENFSFGPFLHRCFAFISRTFDNLFLVTGKDDLVITLSEGLFSFCVVALNISWIKLSLKSEQQDRTSLFISELAIFIRIKPRVSIYCLNITPRVKSNKHRTHLV